MLKIVRNIIVVVTVVLVGISIHSMSAVNKNNAKKFSKSPQINQNLKNEQKKTKLEGQISNTKSENDELQQKIVIFQKESPQNISDKIVNQVKNIMTTAYTYDNQVQTKDVRKKALIGLTSPSVLRKLVSSGEDTAHVVSQSDMCVMLNSALSEDNVKGIIVLKTTTNIGTGSTPEEDFHDYTFTYDQKAQKLVDLEDQSL
ncbi:hypothetical protein [Lactococcus lactis]|uniref:hypothetical protein n=1 Tax=Lactococcus lactis TaxID=1358 RepID=UPI00288DA0EB|nr:hypothetical protein [Lactococcus lactis]MDT2914542.1 hypothetical protein [Lactococcus lactis]MDT2938678.1 hypothetical protein [Lactococcus lactis]